MGAKVLVVDDDLTVSDVVCRYLERSGYEVALSMDGLSALTECRRRRPDLGLILDRILPVLDGLEVCRRLRAAADPPPIIMLTALGEEQDRITGLQMGAEDYVTKPFSPRELVLRTQAVLAPGRAAGDPGDLWSMAILWSIGPGGSPGSLAGSWR